MRSITPYISLKIVLKFVELFQVGKGGEVTRVVLCQIEYSSTDLNHFVCIDV
jgi:hypothetical protein